MLKNSFCLFFLFAAFFAETSAHSWEFEQNIILEGVLRRAERTIIKNSNGKKESKIEKNIVLVTNKPLVLTHSVLLEKQQLASVNISYPHIRVVLPEEFMPLIGKRVQCSGTFQKTFDFYSDEIALNIDVALEQPSHQLKTLFYEPEEQEVSGLLKEIIYPGPSEYMKLEKGDQPEKVVILTLKEPINVEIKGGKKEDDDVNEPEKAVRELQVVFSDSGLTTDQMKKEITLKGTLYHAHTAHHHRRVLIMVKSGCAACETFLRR
jgi:hypothetical protein